jgi:hypothetical protein
MSGNEPVGTLRTQRLQRAPSNGPERTFRMGIGTSIFLIAVGAILDFAVNVTVQDEEVI